MKATGKKNAYRCNACGARIIVVHKDDGLTPFALDCKADCGGDMLSEFYRVMPNEIPTWEWYLPENHRKYKGYTKGDDAAFRDYFTNKGLELRKITPPTLQEGPTP